MHKLCTNTADIKIQLLYCFIMVWRLQQKLIFKTYLSLNRKNVITLLTDFSIMKRQTRIAIYVSIALIVFALPAILFGVLGFRPNKEWNNNAIKDRCYITHNHIIERSCAYDCGYIRFGSGRDFFETTFPGDSLLSPKRSHIVHDICVKKCYDLEVTFGYEYNSTQYLNHREMIIDSFDLKKVQTAQNTTYAVGKIKTCYFQRDNPLDLEFELRDVSGHATGLVLFTAFGSVFVLGFIVLEVVYCKE